MAHGPNPAPVAAMTTALYPDRVCITRDGVGIEMTDGTEYHVTRAQLVAADEWLTLTGEHTATVAGIRLTRDQVTEYLRWTAQLGAQRPSERLRP